MIKQAKESKKRRMWVDDFDEEGAPSAALENSSMAMESAQRATSLQVTSSLPTLRRELMDIRDLLSN